MVSRSIMDRGLKKIENLLKVDYFLYFINMVCRYQPSCKNIPCGLNATILIMMASAALIAICSGATYLDFSLYSMTTCYPIDFSSELGVCTEEIPTGFLPDESRPYPVKAWIKFQFFNPQHNKTSWISYQIVCGDSLQGVIDRAKDKYPPNQPIPCGIKTWQNYPVTMFMHGIPWNQWELMLISSITLFGLMIVYVPLLLCTCKRKVNEVPFADL